MVYPIMTQTLPPAVGLDADKELRNAERRRYYNENRDGLNVLRRARYDKDRSRILGEKRRYYLKHKEEVLERHRRYEAEHPEQEKERAIRWKARVKLEVLGHYCGGTPACAKCGFSDVRALSIDHVNGGGRQHRRLIKGYHIYSWLRKQGYPDGYQVLCMNCQFIKKREENEYGVSDS